MTDPLDELAEALEHATPGRWFWTWPELRSETDDDPGRIVAEPIQGGFGEPEWDISTHDAHFVVTAKNHVGTLLSRLRAAEADVRRLQEALVVSTAIKDALTRAYVALHSEVQSSSDRGAS